MAFAFVEFISSFPAGSSATVGVATAAIALGDLVVVTFGNYGSSANTLDSVDDTLGNSYVAAGATFLLSGTTGHYRTFVCLGATAAGATPTVTGHFSGSVGSRAIIVTRYSITSGVAALNGQSSGNVDSGASPMNSGTIVTTATDLLYGFNNYSAFVPAAPAGWTSRDGSDHVVDDLIGAGAGSYAYQPTFAGSQDWCAEIVAFTEVVASGWGPLLSTGRNRLVQT